ncbi:MAG: VWA domain-containing protein [Acidobacteriota bacterium]
MQRLTVILLGMCLGVCCGATAQQALEPSASGPVFHLDSSLVLLDAIVADHKTGRMVTTLTPEDFALEEDGVPQKIRYFSQDKLPLSIVFLFDLTQTVQPQLKELGAGALDVLDHLKPEDEVAIMAFASTAHMLQPFTKDRTLAATAIQRAATMKTNAATFIDEDVYEGAQAAMQATIPDSRRVLVFFTDGTANYVNKLTKKISSKELPEHLHTRAEARDALLRNGLTVAALIDRSPADDLIIATMNSNPLILALGGGARLHDVEHFAAETGGPVLHGHGRKVAANLAALIEEIRGRYTIGYVPSTRRPAGTFCRIRLKLTPEALTAHPELKDGHYQVRSRAGYYR